MSDSESFLRAIRANPEDDTLRLVFADWLDEHGQPDRAEFIRLQVELDPVRDRLDDPRVQELRDREAALLDAHRREWLGAAADVAAEYPAFGPVFRRGLPEMVCLPLDTFLTRGTNLFAACPTVREVSLYGVAAHYSDLAACPHLMNVETLEIADVNYVGYPEESAALCEAVRAARLPCLRLPGLCEPPFNFPHLLNSLALGIATGWPRWVEFVRIRPDAGIREEVVASLDAVAGRPVTRIIPPYEARFPLAADIGNGLYPGVSEEGESAILAVRPDQTGMWVMFDQHGRQEDAATFGEINPAEVEDWRTQHGKSIRVREFAIGGLSVRLWPQSYVRDYLANPFLRPDHPSPRESRNRGGVLRRWLHEGRFVIEWDGREFVADASGKIVDVLR
jgi:uncharacterized protein (TIGR02996 family)